MKKSIFHKNFLCLFLAFSLIFNFSTAQVIAENEISSDSAGLNEDAPKINDVSEAPSPSPFTLPASSSPYYEISPTQDSSLIPNPTQTPSSLNIDPTLSPDIPDIPSPSPFLSVTPYIETALNITLPPGFAPSATLSPPLFLAPLSKTRFSANESVHLRVSRARSQKELKLELTHAGGQKVSVVILKKDIGQDSQLELVPAAGFKPGKYTLTISDMDGNSVQQDFTWGVLAVNTNKSVYLPGEEAKIAIGVLDELGHIICDAKILLEIKNDNNPTDSLILKTDDGSIKTNDTCGKKDMTLTPDYETGLTTSFPGRYQISIMAITRNGDFSQEDYFEVRDSIDFDVERITATRIYPINLYPVYLKIKANRDFNGVIYDYLPGSFKVQKIEGENLPSFLNPQEILYSRVAADIRAVNIPDLALPLSSPLNISLKYGEKYRDPSLVKNLLNLAGKYGHDGIDFDSPLDSPVYAVDKGIVSEAGSGEYGNTVEITHTWGKSIYGHLDSVIVNKNGRVERADKIGLSGNSGVSTNPHLHLSILPNNPDRNNGYKGKINPLPFLNLELLDEPSPFEDAKMLKITWPVSLKKGDEITLGYSFRAPPQSPEFYLLGPLVFKELPDLSLTESQDNDNSENNESGNLVFSEIRRWQIASDATEYITSGSSWPVPLDWNNIENSIEVIGGGGGGANGANSIGAGGGGGGGGAYSKETNVILTAGGNVSIAIGQAGTIAGAGGDTYFCNSTSNCSSITGTAVFAGAKGGGGATGATQGTGGQASPDGEGSVTRNGGNGGNGAAGSGNAGGGGGGGGGAGGMDAAGSNAGSGSGTTGGTGGQGDGTSGGIGGTGGTGGNPGNPGGPGGNGSEWETGYGSGGGGGGGGAGSGTGRNGGAGGLPGTYGAGGGGGGGGGRNANGASGNIGTQGLIVVFYNVPTTDQQMRHGNWFSEGIEKYFTF